MNKQQKIQLILIFTGLLLFVSTYFFYINGYHWKKLINDSKLECIYNNYNIHNRV